MLTSDLKRRPAGTASENKEETSQEWPKLTPPAKHKILKWETLVVWIFEKISCTVEKHSNTFYTVYAQTSATTERICITIVSVVVDVRVAVCWLIDG